VGAGLIEVVGVIDGTAEERRCCDLIELGIRKTHYLGREALTVDVGPLPVVSLCVDVASWRTRFGGTDAVLARQNDWRNPIRQIEAVRCLMVPLILLEGRWWGGSGYRSHIYGARICALVYSHIATREDPLRVFPSMQMTPASELEKSYAMHR